METDDEVPSLSRTDELKLLPLNRLREFRRMVMVEGTGLPPFTEIDPEREEVREGESEGGGSLDFADWTLSSSFCILPMRPRIWYNEPDLGSLVCGVSLLNVGELLNEGKVMGRLVGKVVRDATVDTDRVLLCALAVTRDREDFDGLESYIDREPIMDSEPAAFLCGNPELVWTDLRMFVIMLVIRLLDVSDIGGDGGGTVTAIREDFIGVVTNKGEDTVDVPGERSKISGACGADDCVDD